MSRSPLVPVVLVVVLAHAALIAIIASAHRDPAPQPVQSTAIVAQLLSSPSDVSHAVARAKPMASAQRKPVEPERPPVKAPAKAPALHTPPPRVAVAAPLPAPAAPPSPAEPAPAAPSTTGTATQATAASSNAAPATPAPARETLAIAAPKHVAHADCRIVKPTYPELSKRREETGTATVRFVIGTTGAIEAVALVKSSGFERLDNAATEALRASACQPYLENGSPIRVAYTQAFTFGLDDD